MTKIVFETATLADAIKKAERVAPTTGQAFDKAAGILFEINPLSTAPVVTKVTNLDIFRMEWLDVVDASGSATTWRVPSRLFTQVVGSLPIGSGKTVTLEEKSEGVYSQLHLSSGRTKARFNLIDGSYYPSWDAFDPDTLLSTVDLGGRIAQVEWAAAKTEAPICGVHFDGEQCVATDRFRLASAPVKFPGLTEPITVPAGILSTLLKQTGEIKVGIDGGQLLLMPDETTQIRCILYGLKYPGMTKVMVTERPNYITVKKTEILEIMNRATTFGQGDRIAPLRTFIGKEEFAVMMTNAEVGLLGDVVELPGQALHDRVEIIFTAKNILDAINSSPNEEVTIGYDTANPLGVIYVDGGSGYKSWIVPRKKVEEQ